MHFEVIMHFGVIMHLGVIMHFRLEAQGPTRAAHRACR
jgi:hypothetical protein